MTAARRRAHYPTKAIINRVVQAARDNGIDVVGVEVSPEGAVRVVDARTAPRPPANDFDRWESQL